MSTSIVPTIWAQREDKVYLTFKNTTCSKWKVDYEKNQVIFTAEDKKGSYENALELYDEISTDENTASKKGLGVECTIMKKNPAWWPRLLSKKAKHHWLKVDFQKWKDEDDSDIEEDWAAGEPDPSAPGQPDLAAMMAQMGGGAAMGEDTMGGLTGESDSEIDSDDEDIPGLENDANPTLDAQQEVPPPTS